MTLAVQNDLANNDPAAAYSMHGQLVPTFLTAEVAQAAQQGQLARVCKWLNEGGPVDARDVFQFSLLHLAAGAGQVLVVRELIKRGASLDVSFDKLMGSLLT